MLCTEEGAGNLYFDDVQLERGATASSYNYVFNGNFDYGTEGYDIAAAPFADVGSATQHDGTRGSLFRAPGLPDFLPLAWQDIPINETVDADHPCTYQFSAWAKASTSALTPQRTFQITARVIYAGGQLVSILGTNPDYRIDLIYDESGVQSCIYTAGTAAPVTYYLIKNAQGDVMQLRDEADTIVANYAYDAFGRLLSITDIDGKAISDQTSFAHRNPLRYRGYLYDSETGFYYLGSRYYDPKIRRFINADNNLSSASICGYNLFAYCGNNPVNRTDATGEAWWHWALGAAIVVGCAVATVATCGGFAAAAGAVAAVCAGTAAASTAATVAASAFVGSAAVYGSLSLSSLADSASVEDFNNKGNWGTVASTAGGAIVGGVNGYTVSKALTPKTVGRGMHNPKIRAAAQRGVLEHKQMDYGPNVDKEVTIASGCRVDGIDFKNRIIYELKPNNPRAIARGLSQLNRYTEAASQRYGGKWTGTLRLYD